MAQIRKIQHMCQQHWLQVYNCFHNNNNNNYNYNDNDNNYYYNDNNNNNYNYYNNKAWSMERTSFWTCDSFCSISLSCSASFCHVNNNYNVLASQLQQLQCTG